MSWQSNRGPIATKADSRIYSSVEVDGGHPDEAEEGGAAEMRPAGKRAFCKALQRLSVHAPVFGSLKLTCSSASDKAFMKRRLKWRAF